MSVLIISPKFFQENSARAIQVRKLHKAFSEHALDFYLATSAEKKDVLAGNIIQLHSETSLLDKFRDGPVSANISILEEFINSKNIDTVLTISSPISATLIGLSLKTRNPSLKWISYFSDPLPVYANPEPYSLEAPSVLMRIQHKYHLFLTKKSVRKADVLIMPSRNTLKYFEKLYSLSLSDKTEIIPHIGGELMSSMEDSSDKNLSKHLVYLGDFYQRGSGELIEAVKISAEKNQDQFKGVICYGTHHTEEFRRMIVKLGAQKYFKIYPAVDYEESLQLMKQSQVLLLIEADMDESPFMPSKYFDYLFSNRPILAISPSKNSLEEYYKEDEHFVIVQHDRDEIVSAIEKLFNRPPQKIKRNLSHLKSDLIIKKYLNLLQS